MASEQHLLGLTLLLGRTPVHTRACTQASVSCVCVHHCTMPCAGRCVPELGCPLVGVGIALGLQGGPQVCGAG